MKFRTYFIPFFLETNVYDLPNGVYFSSLEKAGKQLNLSSLVILN